MASSDEWLVFILLLFLGMGFFLPFVNQAFGQSYTGTSPDVIKDKIDDTSVSPTNPSVGFTDIVFSMFTIFFWTFGGIPAWLDLTFFMTLRFLLIILIYNKARGI